MLYLPTVLPANSKSSQPLWNTSQRWKGFGVQHRKRTTAPSLLQRPRSDTESIDEKHCTEATLSFFPVQVINFSWGWLSTGTSCPAREAVQCPSLELYKKATWTCSWAACLSRGAGAVSLQRCLLASAMSDWEALAWRSPGCWISHTSWLSETFGLSVFQMIGTVLIPWANSCRHFPERVPKSGLALNQFSNTHFKGELLVSCHHKNL